MLVHLLQKFAPDTKLNMLHLAELEITGSIFRICGYEMFNCYLMCTSRVSGVLFTISQSQSVVQFIGRHSQEWNLACTNYWHIQFTSLGFEDWLQKNESARQNVECVCVCVCVSILNPNNLQLVAVVVVMTSPSGTAYMRGQRYPEQMRNSTRLWIWRDSSLPRDSWQPFIDWGTTQGRLSLPTADILSTVVKRLMSTDVDKLSSCSRFSDSAVGFTGQKTQCNLQLFRLNELYKRHYQSNTI